jgi:hypothetical protein
MIDATCSLHSFTFTFLRKHFASHCHGARLHHGPVDTARRAVILDIAETAALLYNHMLMLLVVAGSCPLCCDSVVARHVHALLLVCSMQRRIFTYRDNSLQMAQRPTDETWLPTLIRKLEGFVPALSWMCGWSSDHMAAVELQTEAAHADVNSNIWAAIRAADEKSIDKMLNSNPGLIHVRGPVGETVLHLCYLFNTNSHKAIARRLLNRDPSLITSIYEKPQYMGENVLHMAIANEDESEARFLLRICPTLIHGRATGNFFSINGSAYYGASPLGFAVCTNQANFVMFLIVECGAFISDRDAHGNTAAHMAVYHNRLDMYELLERLWNSGYGKPPDLSEVPLHALRNNDAYTPIVLASALGLKDMCICLWERQRNIEWKWGSITAITFPLEHIDSIAQLIAEVNLKTGKDEAAKALGLLQAAGPLPSSGRVPTVLDIVVNAQQTDILMVPRLQQLLEKKWVRFGRTLFLQKLLRTFLLAAIFTYTIVQRSELPEDHKILFPALRSTCPQEFDTLCWASTVGEGIILVASGAQILLEVSNAYNSGVASYFAVRGAGRLEIWLRWGWSASILAGFWMHAFHGHHAAKILLSLSSIFQYTYCAWFLLGFRLTGPFIVMITHMLTKDLIRFLLITGIFLLGFTQAFFLLEDRSGSADFFNRLRASFITMISPDLPDSDQFIVLAPAVLYVVLASVTLLNLLIAMLGDTYSRIHEIADSQYQMERSRIMLSLERSMNAADRLQPSRKYWNIQSDRPFLHVEEKDDSVFANSERSATTKAAMEQLSVIGPAGKRGRDEMCQAPETDQPIRASRQRVRNSSLTPRRTR